MYFLYLLYLKEVSRVANPVRVYKFAQFLTNSRTGELMFTLDMLKAGLAYRSIKGWSYVLHDKDDGVEPHYHVLFWTEKAFTPEQLGPWFGVPGHRIERVRGGRAGLVDEIQYQTHERTRQEDGKYPYPDSEIIASPGWDWRAEVTEVLARRAAGNGNGRRRSRAIDLEVREEGLSVREALRRGTSIPIGRLRRQRAAFLADQKSTEVRVNFYVHGTDALVAEALARGLATTLAAQGDGHVYTMRKGVDDYDGESVILVPNARPMRMTHSLQQDDAVVGGRELFDALATIPSGATIGTEFGPSQLVHRNVVMSGTEPFEKFRKELERFYSRVSANAEQDSYSHVPVIVPVSAEDFGVQLNRAFFDGGPYDEYVSLARVRNQLHSVLRSSSLAVEGDDDVQRELLGRQFRVAIDAGDRVRDELASEALTPDELLNRFEDLGEPIVEDQAG